MGPRYRWSVYWLATRPKFLTASAAPVLVGSAAGLASAETLHWSLFLLALVGVMALHAGANVINDYFDHVSGNDWVNTNPTPFSGGRRFIQQGILTPRATLLTGLAFLGIGAAAGLVILASTRSLLILGLGLAGLLGGFFYTAKPVQLGYRGIGELVIAFLFGLLPVYGSCVLQTGRVEGMALLPALIVSALIFLVIFINEFPDRLADAQVGKRTLVVRLGVPRSVRLYRLVLAYSYALAGGMLVHEVTFWAGVFYLLTLPLAGLAWCAANPQDLATPGRWRGNQLTILLHATGSLGLTLGLGLYWALT
jgi:1,4-dihydroxy-2-naphthoate octaprenyltransferase